MSTMFTYHSTQTHNIISTVAAVIKRLGAHLAQGANHRERACEEAYLAESSDRYDLEYRMRQLSRANPQANWMSGLSR